jgi:hypothetical protein
MEPCAICGHPNTDGAHVKPREAWGDHLPPDHRERNIIPLCPNHHRAFDKDRSIGVCPDKSGFVVLVDGELQYAPTRVSISTLRDDYILLRNSSCVRLVRIGLGVIPGLEERRLW